MLYIKAGTFIYVYLTVSIARMLAASSARNVDEWCER